MSVLLLRLAGPLQSWGVSGRFAWRTTAPAPTKSGIVGMLAAALGRSRDADLADLAALRFAVRIDQAGTRVRDFQTAHHGVTDKPMPLSERFYLADAVFVAAVEGRDPLIDHLHAAVREPHYLPYLGRRSCPPAEPIDLGIRPAGLREALQAEPWRASAWYQKRRASESVVALETLIEVEPGDRAADLQRDQPISFDPRHRRYDLRSVRSGSVRVPNPSARRPPAQRHTPPPEHDPMAHLEGF
jgi:CRISPR system Cascade subunit CasD